MPDPLNPQSLNSYSYCLNNPLKYIDPTGHYDQGDYTYETLCESSELDPAGGYMFVLGAGGEITGRFNTGYTSVSQYTTFYIHDSIYIYNMGAFGNKGGLQGYGDRTISGKYTYKDGLVIVDIHIFTGYTSRSQNIDVTYLANIIIGANEYRIMLKESEGPSLVPYYLNGYACLEGTKQIANIPEQSNPILEIKTGAKNTSYPWDELGNYIVEPSGYYVDLNTDKVTIITYYQDLWNQLK